MLRGDKCVFFCYMYPNFKRYSKLRLTDYFDRQGFPGHADVNLRKLV
jgi:hypothetical protein